MFTEIPPTASNINVLNVTDSTAIITWSIQEGHSITTVIIRYKIFDDTGYNHDIKIRNITITQYQLKGLEADTIYQIELCTENNVGQSISNPIRDVRTRQEVKGETVRIKIHFLKNEKGIANNLNNNHKC